VSNSGTTISNLQGGPTYYYYLAFIIIGFNKTLREKLHCDFNHQHLCNVCLFLNVIQVCLSCRCMLGIICRERDRTLRTICRDKEHVGRAHQNNPRTQGRTSRVLNTLKESLQRRIHSTKLFNTL
jgi:hypothetical protein